MLSGEPDPTRSVTPPPPPPPTNSGPETRAVTPPPPASSTLSAEPDLTRSVTPPPPPANYQCQYELKYGKDIHAQILAWMRDVTGKPLEGKGNDDTLIKHLRSGEVLCELANAIKPGSVKRIERKAGPFPMRENIARFLAAAKDIGVPNNELFDTPDLFEGRNMRQVRVCIFALGRATHDVAGYTGPRLGKPVRSKAGAHNKSQYKVQTNTGLWGKAGGAHLPMAGVGQAKMRPITTTGRPEVEAPVLS